MPLKTELIAAARANGADGSTAGAGFFALGCTIARTGAGRYTLTIDNGPLVGEADSSECIVKVTPEVADVAPFVVHTSDSVKTISINSTVGAGATAADSTFQVEVTRARSFVGG